MQSRKLGWTDLQLTVIGFGAWAIGGPWQYGWGPQDDAESIATLQRALDLGINWIDTAPAYGLGHSEQVVGQTLRGRQGRVIVATKCGLTWDDPSTRRVINRLKAQSVRKEAEDSLRRLGVDVIDLYQIHWPNPDMDIEEGWTEIARLVEEGKVRYAGVSNFSGSQIRRMQTIHPVASLQPPYSLVDRGVEKELLTYCAAQKIGVVAYSPMASGLLTGKFTRKAVAELPAEDWRHTNAHFKEPELDANLSLIEKLRPIAARRSRTVAQLAIAWVLRRPEVTAAIVGARHPSQVAEIASAAGCALTNAEIAEIDPLLAERDAAL